MPTRARLLAIVAVATLCPAGVASAQSEPSSGYKLRYDRGPSQRLDVSPAGAEQTGAKASLSDEQPEPVLKVEARGQRLETTPDLNSEDPPPTSVLKASSDQPLKLAPRSESSGRQLAKPAAASPTEAVGTIVGSLAVVLGLFVVVVWISRRLGPVGSAPLPKEAVELLGRTTISGQHALQLVRVGERLLLVALSPHGAVTLTEITNPSEVERLTAICLRQRPGSASASFAQTVTQLEREPASRSFVEQRRSASSAAVRVPRVTSRA